MTVWKSSAESSSARREAIGQTEHFTATVAASKCSKPSANLPGSALPFRPQFSDPPSLSFLHIALSLSPWKPKQPAVWPPTPESLHQLLINVPETARFDGSPDRLQRALCSCLLSNALRRRCLLEHSGVPPVVGNLDKLLLQLHA